MPADAGAGVDEAKDVVKPFDDASSVGLTPAEVAAARADELAMQSRGTITHPLDVIPTHPVDMTGRVEWRCGEGVSVERMHLAPKAQLASSNLAPNGS